MMNALVAAMVLAFSGEAAPAEQSPRVELNRDSTRANYVLSMPVLPLFAGGFSLQGERYFAEHSWSLAANLGARSSTAGDYGSLHLFAGMEIRRWLGHVGPLAKNGYGPLGGPFVSARFDLAWNRLERTGAGTIGGGLLTSESVGLGYRLLPWWRLEVTPSAGIAVNHLDARRWASVVRVTAVFGLTLGCVF